SICLFPLRPGSRPSYPLPAKANSSHSESNASPFLACFLASTNSSRAPEVVLFREGGAPHSTFSLPRIENEWNQLNPSSSLKDPDGTELDLIKQQRRVSQPIRVHCHAHFIPLFPPNSREVVHFFPNRGLFPVPAALVARSTTLKCPNDTSASTVSHSRTCIGDSEILGQTPSFSALSFVSQCPLGNVSHQASAQCTTDHSQLPNLRPSSCHRSPKPMGRSRPCRLVFRTIAAHLQRHCNCQLHLEQSFAHCKAINNPK
ncbi:hypothetical protein FRX31_020929, partial [Thalictrum thalictroides]